MLVFFLDASSSQCALIFRIKKVAMIQSRQGEALEMLFTCAKNGDWLILQNVHFVADWLPSLEKEIEIALEECNDSFMLWMITEEHRGFPTSLVQKCHKVALEPPPGMKQNMLRTYDLLEKQSTAMGDGTNLQLLFILAWFHAIVTERRSFLRQGWTKKYDFGDGDLLAGSTFLSEGNPKKSVHIDWGWIHGLLSKAIYGSHIDDDFDFRILNCYIETYFSSDVLTGVKELIPGIKVPTESTIDAHLNVILKLPDCDQPSTFGLPSNIGRSQQKFMAESLTRTLSMLTYGNESDENRNTTSVAEGIKRLITSWEQLVKSQGICTEDEDFEELQKKFVEGDDFLTHFLYTERNLGWKLYKTVARYFQKLCNNQSLLVGQGGDTNPSVVGKANSASFSSGSSSILMKLLRDEVPREWANIWAVSDSSDRLADWLEGFVRRTKALNELLLVLKDG